LLPAAAVIAAAVVVARRRGLAPVRVEGASMEPSLPPGALVAVWPPRRDPSYGAVVVVRRDDGTEHIKRVVDLPAPGEFTVAGDNRAASTDSRHYGPVKRSDITAVAVFCYWPPRAWGLLTTPG
jgi:signal peptidase I